MILVAGGTIVLMERGGHGLAAFLGEDWPGGGDKRWLVPLLATTTRWEHYTMLSWLHLRDFLNQQLLVAPVVLPSILILGKCVAPRARDHGGRPGDAAVGVFLALAAGSHLLLTWLWNPDYGGQRDWDLFSLAAISTTLLLVWILPRALPTPGRRRAGVIPLILVQGLHTIAWIYQNRLPWDWPT